MKAKLVALAVISAFALSACGGGSDSSPKVNNKTNGGSAVSGDTGNGSGNSGSGNSGSGNSGSGNSGSGNSGSGNSGSGNSGSGNSGSGNSGSGNSGSTTTETPYTMEQQVSAWKISISGDTAQFSNKQIRAGNDGDDFDNIVVDGKKMSISQYGKANLDHIGRIDGTDGTAYARYGLIVSETKMEGLAFFQGKPTEISDMPTANGVKYVGQVFAWNPTKGVNVITGGEVNGTSTFTVNFADKTMSGDLTNWKGSTNFVNPGNIHIEAKIKGNSFSTKDATGTTANVKAEGKFYGPQAANLAGAFSNTQTGVQGAFGAKKQ